jgi:hypothetical protein
VFDEEDDDISDTEVDFTMMWAVKRIDSVKHMRKAKGGKAKGERRKAKGERRKAKGERRKALAEA